jgi:hypothetical protein
MTTSEQMVQTVMSGYTSCMVQLIQLQNERRVLTLPYIIPHEIQMLNLMGPLGLDLDSYGAASPIVNDVHEEKRQ